MMRLIVCLIFAVTSFRCGVEAGNAGGVKSKTGNVQILFAQQQNSGGESLSVQVASLGLLASDDSEEATLTPSSASSSVDLYGSSSGANLLVAESSFVPTGSYFKIAVRLTDDRPVRYRDASGKDHNVSLDEESKHSFYFTQSITISQNETTTIIVNLDPYKSLQSGSDDRFVFKPRGDAMPKDRDLTYSGTTSVVGAEWVCAYAYSVEQDPGNRGGGLKLEGGGMGGSGKAPPPPGPKIDGRPTFGSDGDLIKDNDESCANAFAKAPIVNGKFDIHHLQPAHYALRIFSSNGSYSDQVGDIEVRGNPKP